MTKNRKLFWLNLQDFLAASSFFFFCRGRLPRRASLPYLRAPQRTLRLCVFFILFSFHSCHKILQTVPFSPCTVLNFHSPFFFRSLPRSRPTPNPLQNRSLS